MKTQPETRTGTFTRPIVKKSLAVTAGTLMLLSVGIPSAFAAAPNGEPTSALTSVASAENRARAASDIQRRMQPLLQDMVDSGLPGVAAFVRDGDKVASLAAGSANLATSSSMTPEHHMRVGSITKTYTATIILQLVDEGMLALDDTVEDVLPGMVPGGESITLRQLLNHTSGLFDYTYDPKLMEPYLNPDGTFNPSNHYTSPLELVAASNANPPRFAPGEDWEYSNTNYILLGLAIEKVTGHQYAYELHDRIIEPLGLKDTKFPERSTAIQEPDAHGYQLYGLPSGPFDITRISPSFAWAAGGITSSVEDMARFGKALMNGELMSDNQLAEMKTTVNEPSSGKPVYGLGLVKVEVNGVTLWGHGGDLPGYHTSLLTSEDGRQQIAMIANAGLDTWNAEQAADWTAATRGAFLATPQASPRS